MVGHHRWVELVEPRFLRSPRHSFNVEPGFLWKGGGESFEQLVEQQHTEAMSVEHVSCQLSAVREQDTMCLM